MENNMITPAATAPLVAQSAKDKLEAEVANLAKKLLIHEKFKKHCAKDRDGEEGYDSDADPAHLDYSTMICPGCGMPVQSDGWGSDTTYKFNANSMNALFTSDKKQNHPAAWLLSHRTRMTEFFKKTNERHQCDHLRATPMFGLLKDHLDINKIREHIVRTLDSGKDYSVSEPLAQLVRIEENLLGGATPDTISRLVKKYTGAEDTYRDSRDMAASLHIALAIKHKLKLERTDITQLMKRCKNLGLKHELTAKLGAFRLGAVRGTVFSDCWPSYFYIKKYKPELLKDEKWVSKKLRFDKQENKLVMLRYWLDFGIGYEAIESRHHDLMCAIAYYVPKLHAANVDAIEAYKHKAIFADDNSELQMLFGDREAKKKNCDSADVNCTKMLFCKDVDEWIQSELPESMMSKTGNPVSDILALQD